MKKFEKILVDLKEKSPLNFLYDNGYTPETIKEEIVTTLNPFFNDNNNLQEYAIKYLVSDWVEFIKLKTFHPDSEKIIISIISHYRSAKIKDSVSVFSAINSLMPLQLDAGNKFWSFLKLEVDKSKLDFEEFVQTSFKDISDIIEGLMKVFLYENLAIDRINRCKTTNIVQIRQLDLGVIIEELVANRLFKNLLLVPPENLKLSDWRNISAHQNHKLIPDDKILCEYGQKHNRKTIVLTKSDIFDRVSKIYYSLRLLNIAHKLFCFDNLRNIIDAGQIPKNNFIRDEIGFLMFASSIYSQGFIIKRINYEKNGDAVMVVKDLTNGDPQSRGIHASQFVYPLWVISNCNTTTVEYKTKEGVTFLTAQTTKEVCEKINTGEKPLKYLAEKVKFEIKTI